jgi:hypothetical protein
LIAAVVVVVALVTFASNLISHRMAAQFEDAQFSLMGEILRSQLRRAESRAISAAELVAAIPSVRQAFAARDRDALLALTRPAFEIQKEKYGISQAQFHLAPAVSFLRVHNPAKFGEDLAFYRNLVVEVNRTQAIRKGTEVTTSGIGIFGTLPVLDLAGSPVGSFEMAYDFGPQLDELKNEYGFELGLFVEEKILRETATSLSAEIYNDQNRFGSHVSFASTHPVLIRELLRSGDLEVREEVRHLRTSAGVSYGLLLQPVYDYAGRQFGVVAVAKSFAATRSADGQALVWQTLVGVFAAVLLIGAITTVVRGLLLRPLAVLSACVAGAANDPGATAIEVSGAVCAEVEELAERCERLRLQVVQAPASSQPSNGADRA